jgi:hypothetical protein
VVTENRNGLVVDVRLTQATGTAERETLRKAKKRLITQREAAEELGLSLRQVPTSRFRKFSVQAFAQICRASRARCRCSAFSICSCGSEWAAEHISVPQSRVRGRHLTGGTAA